ncbi:hypothetical protein TNCV_1634821 [Trichonephila clavipes]|nr:hypothetical protein TNCV_1634821 [Trichonephila clavipes]
MTTATLDASSQTVESSMMRSTMNLNSSHYIFSVLRPVSVPFIRALQNPTFLKNNAWTHVAGTLRISLDTENVRLLPWHSRSPDLSPIENVWSMASERLASQHTPITTVDELWHGIEAV